MKYAVISDIHSNLDALEAVIDQIPKTMPVLCLGDIVGYGAQPNEVIEAVQGLKPVAVLMGNHDYAVVTGNVEDFSTYAVTAIAVDEAAHYFGEYAVSIKTQIRDSS